MAKYKVVADYWDIEKDEYIEKGPIIEVTKKRAEEINANIGFQVLVEVKVAKE
ncbi:Uncharacterised protein [Streptococcus suis]|uniref:hypothetical protein n=1 Tax=Streptococcus TaxID=1301 RepID=UPI000768F72D|nr:hypothetical protein [Streptococcus suis]NRG94592.1 hypothetical protein [Streptococcus suis]CZB15528.1 Uncharacterised protein [Streptococcus suis]